jgi:hypothetical protein
LWDVDLDLGGCDRREGDGVIGMLLPGGGAMDGGDRTSSANINLTFPGIISNGESTGRERREWRT